MEIAPKDWEQIKAFFNAALEQPPSERSVYLGQQCPDAYRTQVEQLLHDHEQAKNFLTIPIFQHNRGAATGSGATLDAVQATSEGHGVPTLNFALRVGSASESEEIEPLLRRRLRNIVLIAIAVHTFFNALRLVRLNPLFRQAWCFSCGFQQG